MRRVSKGRQGLGKLQFVQPPYRRRCVRTWRLFFAMLVCVMFTISGRMGAVNTAGSATVSSLSASVTNGRAAILRRRRSVCESGLRGGRLL